jgi:predicted dinucleotide-binding enzyme
MSSITRMMAVLTCSALIGGVFTPYRATAETVAVIGTGNVAAALGPQFAKLGHRIVYGSRDPDRDSVRALVARTHTTASATNPLQAAEQAEIVVLATPWNATEQVVRALGDLSGKIILDPTNSYAPGPDGLRQMGVATSTGELIQGWAPKAYVVKAFNTLNAATMADPNSAGGPVTIPIVGDNQAAKDKVASLITGIGFEVADLGPIRYAHVVEGMLIVWMNARIRGRPFEFHLRPYDTD